MMLPSSFSLRRFAAALLLLSLLTVLLASLYGPFTESSQVFDDFPFFQTRAVYRAAITPFSLAPRTFPYFSIGLVHVLAEGDLAWNRYLSTALHGLVVIALYFFLRRATSRVAVDTVTRQSVLLFVCLWVALNPAAVYGAAYLIQRTILLACLCSLLAASLYLRAQQEARTADLFSAALLATLATMMKEHALLLPAALVVLTPLVSDWNRASLRRAALFLALSLPYVVWVALNIGKGLISKTYEPYAEELAALLVQLGIADHFPGKTWGLSIATQLLLFWKYLFLWLFPNPQWMSVDLRVDFPALWSSWPGFAALATSLLVWLTATGVWLRSLLVPVVPASPRWQRLALASALLFAAIPFVVELSVVRLKEPLVLYRSYLWMPAYALLLCLLLLRIEQALGKRQAVWLRLAFWGVLLLAAASLFPLAQDRLRSFSSEEALWQDARQKLPYPDVTGSWRIYYNLTNEAIKRRDFDEALRNSEIVIAQTPELFPGYLVRGVTLLAMRDLDTAWQLFDEADRRNSSRLVKGIIENYRCSILESRGEKEALIACLGRAAENGHELARLRYKMLTTQSNP